MRGYKSKLKSAAKMEGGETSSKELLGELHEIYYENRDLRLMLDLLAKSSGLAPPLRYILSPSSGLSHSLSNSPE